MARRPVVGTQINGLREFNRGIRKADLRLAAYVQTGFRAIAMEVAQEARGIAESKGLRESGDLIRGIVPYSRIGGAGVRSRAVHRGFNYPLRLEFEGRGPEGYGEHASLYPAVRDAEPKIEEQTFALLNSMVDDDLAGGIIRI